MELTKEGDAIKYLVAVLLSAVFVIATNPKGQSPALTKTVAPKAEVVKPATPVVTPTTVEQQPKPELVQVSTPAPVAQGCEAYRPIIAQYAWDVRTAMAIMRAESGCNPTATSPSAGNYDGVPDYGLFQLHGLQVYDPAENIRLAYTIKYLKGGWKHWSVYNSGKYLSYL